jgi:ribosomal protein L7Ae-like RNA K-turn-binding protein
MMNKSLSALGLAYRARKIAIGEDSIFEAIRENKAKLIIIAHDASELTRKKTQDKCLFYGVKYLNLSTKIQLGSSIGKEMIAIIAILDNGFAKLILKNENLAEVKKIDK